MVVTVSEKKYVHCSIVGDGMVGKTCLALTMATQTFPESYVATVFDNYAARLSVAGESHTISMFDSAGQHDYEGLRAFTYRDSEVCVVCYSVVDRESFESVMAFWEPEIATYMRRKRPIILVATQKDLRDKNKTGDEMPVTTEEGEKLAKQIGAESFVECSALTQENVKQVFERIVLSALKYRKRKCNILHRIFGR